MFKELIIGLLFSEEVGGQTVHYIEQSVEKLGARVQHIDYRQIVGTNEDLEDILRDSDRKKAFLHERRQRAKPFLEGIHGLILPGNAKAVHPELYGGTRNEPLEAYDLARSLAEITLLSRAFQQGLPTLGVCGGLEILNVFLGGTLKKLTSKELEIHGYKATGQACLKPSSSFAQTIGTEEITVWGAHEWVIDRLGGQGMINPRGTHPQNYLEIVAFADDQVGNVEGIEATVGAPWKGLQFHWEVIMNQQAIHEEPGSSSFQIQPLPPDIIEPHLKIVSTFLAGANTYRYKQLTLGEIKYTTQAIDP